MLSLSIDVQRDFDSLVTPTTFVSSSLPRTVPLTDYASHAFDPMPNGFYDPAAPTPDALLMNWHAATSSDIDTSVYSSHSSSPATSFRSTPPAQSPMEDKAYVVAAGLEEDPFEVFAFGESLRPFDALTNPSKSSSQHLEALVPESLQPLSLVGALKQTTTATTATAGDMFSAAMAAEGATTVFAALDEVAHQQQQPFVNSLDYGAQQFVGSHGIHNQQHTHTQYSFVQSAPPSSLDFPPAVAQQQPAPPAQQQHAFYSPQAGAYPQQQQQQQQPQSSFQFVANPSQPQPYVPVQFTTLNGATYAVAVPVSSQTPQAIETPHGTYYFVPSSLPPVQQQQQAPTPQTIQAVSPPAPSPPAVESPPEPTHAPTQGLRTRSMAGGRPKRAPLTSSSIVVPSGTHAAVQAATNAALAVANVATLSSQQKIRLPVGQGKKGSTKRRPPKKEQPKRFVCPHPGCGRPFTRNFNMQSHYKSHLGIREFDCPACPKKFSRRHDRARHCAAVHELFVDREGDALSREQSEEADDEYAVLVLVVYNGDVKATDPADYSPDQPEDKNVLANGKERPIETAEDIATRCISLEDDPSMAIHTFRMYFLGIGFTAFAAVLGQIFYFRPQTVYVSQLFLQVITFFMGRAWSAVLPNASRGKFWAFLNPCPFTLKEHVAIVIMSATAASSAEAISVFAADELYYHITPNYGVAIFTLLASQLLGYGIAGLMRSFCVFPTYIVYPNLVPTVNLFDALHRDKNVAAQKKRLKFFWIVFETRDSA
ncbi:hypothetical protein JCM10296v2_006559 [Rhodotorula toruloides]